MNRIKRITAVCLIAAMMSGLAACTSSGPNTGSMITGNGVAILNYLEGLNADKTAILTEHTEPEQYIETGYTAENLGSGNTQICHVEMKTAEKQTESFPIGYRAAGKVYPGAILSANTKILHGNPDSLEGDDLPREDLNIKLISGNESVGSITVKSPDADKVVAAIGELRTKITAPAVNKTYACAAAWSDAQVNAVLGIDGASAYFGVDYSAMRSGKTTQMIAAFDSICYSAEAETDYISRLFGKSVDAETIKNHGVDENNPGLLEVSSVDYGKRYVVVLRSNSVNVSRVLTAWYGGIAADGINNTDRSVFGNTQFKVFELTAKGYELVKESDDLSEVNSILRSAQEISDMDTLMPLSYKAEFVTDKSAAVGSISANYYAAYFENKRSTHVKISGPSLYRVKQSEFYAKRITGINNDGVFELGDWECILNTSNGDAEFYIDSDYAEYGYAFDAVWGTDWPYADYFWNQSNGFAEDILIDLGGSARQETIKIFVNGTPVFSDTNCDSHRNIFH